MDRIKVAGWGVAILILILSLNFESPAAAGKIKPGGKVKLPGAELEGGDSGGDDDTVTPKPIPDNELRKRRIDTSGTTGSTGPGDTGGQNGGELVAGPDGGDIVARRPEESSSGDCRIGDYSDFAPNNVLSGWLKDAKFMIACPPAQWPVNADNTWFQIGRQVFGDKLPRLKVLFFDKRAEYESWYKALFHRSPAADEDRAAAYGVVLFWTGGSLKGDSELSTSLFHEIARGWMITYTKRAYGVDLLAPDRREAWLERGLADYVVSIFDPSYPSRLNSKVQDAIKKGAPAPAFNDLTQLNDGVDQPAGNLNRWLAALLVQDALGPEKGQSQGGGGRIVAVLYAWAHGGAAMAEANEQAAVRFNGLIARFWGTQAFGAPTTSDVTTGDSSDPPPPPVDGEGAGSVGDVKTAGNRTDQPATPTVNSSVLGQPAPLTDEVLARLKKPVPHSETRSMDVSVLGQSAPVSPEIGADGNPASKAGPVSSDESSGADESEGSGTGAAPSRSGDYVLLSYYKQGSGVLETLAGEVKKHAIFKRANVCIGSWVNEGGANDAEALRAALGDRACYAPLVEPKPNLDGRKKDCRPAKDLSCKYCGARPALDNLGDDEAYDWGIEIGKRMRDEIRYYVNHSPGGRPWADFWQFNELSHGAESSAHPRFQNYMAGMLEGLYQGRPTFPRPQCGFGLQPDKPMKGFVFVAQPGAFVNMEGKYAAKLKAKVAQAAERIYGEEFVSFQGDPEKEADRLHGAVEGSMSAPFRGLYAPLWTPGWHVENQAGDPTGLNGNVDHRSLSWVHTWVRRFIRRRVKHGVGGVGMWAFVGGGNDDEKVIKEAVGALAYGLGEEPKDGSGSGKKEKDRNGIGKRTTGHGATSTDGNGGAGSHGSRLTGTGTDTHDGGGRAVAAHDPDTRLGLATAGRGGDGTVGSTSHSPPSTLPATPCEESAVVSARERKREARWVKKCFSLDVWRDLPGGGPAAVCREWTLASESAEFKNGHFEAHVERLRKCNKGRPFDKWKCCGT